MENISWPITTLITIGLGLMILERPIPNHKLPQVTGWWLRVIIINLAQIGIVVLGGITWEIWFQGSSLFHLDSLPNPVSALFAYLLITFVYYWWHKWRHDSNFLWLTLHQIHHSPQRIETITSFYKHPLEILINSIIISFVTYSVLGLSLEAGAWVTVYTGIAEFFYHMNIRTPYWAGYFIQRPESHRIHHERSRHYKNFSDLPIWDILFGTFENPKRRVHCGFKSSREQKFVKMLLFKNVNNPLQKK